MSVFRQPEDFAEGMVGGGPNCNRLPTITAVRCTERVTDRGDTWEMSMFNTARKEWAGSDPTRLKQMAAMFLAVSCDWEYEAVALALGYGDRTGAHHAAKAAINGFRKHMSA